MDARLKALLDELHEHGISHDATKTDRLQRLRNLEPDTATLLALLVRAATARKVLELGTSNGYSTLWLADATRDTGGRVTSVELDPERSEQAQANLRRAGLHEQVELTVGDAGQALERYDDGEWDLIFLDAERPLYVSYWEQLVRVLRSGGLLAVDNVLSHASEVAEFRQLVEGDERVSEALAPVGAGLLLVYRGGD